MSESGPESGQEPGREPQSATGLDAEARAVLDLLASLGVPDFADLTPVQARELSIAPPPEHPTAIGSVEDRTISGDIALRIYRAAEPSGGTLVYFHGGGWVIGDLQSHDETCRVLCRRSGVTVVAVDYRLAPETRFPGAIDDCYAALGWAAQQIDLPGPIAVGGDSAGGNLAAAVALRARDEGGPPIAFQLLIYPVTDADFDTASYHDNAEGYLLTRRAMQWFWNHYVPEHADRQHPYASPLRAADHSGLPPALVMTAGFDPLRDEGEAYATALQNAGVDTTHTRYSGLIHGFFGMQAAIGAADQAMDEAAGALTRHLASTATT